MPEFTSKRVQFEYDGDPSQGAGGRANGAVAVALVILALSTLLSVVGILLGAIPSEAVVAVAAAAGAAAPIWYLRRP